MGTAQTKNLMAEMKFTGMLDRIDSTISEATSDSWSYVEFLDSLLQAEFDSRHEKRTISRINKSKLRLKPEMEDIDFTAKRTITKAQIKELYKLKWLNDGRSVILVGQTGVGKTFIAQALALHACRSDFSALFMSVSTFLENIMLARTAGKYLNFRDKLTKPDLFILDDFGLRKFTSLESQDFCEILEERSIGKSTIITTQLPISHWKEVIPDPVIADAIIDRLIHSSIKIEIKGDSYRKVNANKLDSNKQTK